MIKRIAPVLLLTLVLAPPRAHATARCTVVYVSVPDYGTDKVTFCPPPVR